MDEIPAPPPIADAPPVMSPPVIEGLPAKPKNAFQRAWGAFVAFVAATWKFVYPVIKLAKGAKILLTMGTMLLSVWYYSRFFGWQFGAGFVVCILIHELGHVFAAWRVGIPVSAPIFIPGFGALILGKRAGDSAWEGAIVGYGGPLFGTLAGLACWGIFGLTGNALFLGLAFTAFLMNLFNMTPIYPLDGGRITAAVSPYIWIAGLVGMLAMTLTGFVTNPFIWLLIIMALPNIWSGLRRGTMDSRKRTTPGQRVTAGVAYVGLCAFLLWGMMATSRFPSALRRANPRPVPTHRTTPVA